VSIGGEERVPVDLVRGVLGEGEAGSLVPGRLAEVELLHLQTLCQNITASKNAKKSASVSASTAAATSSTPTSNCSSPSSDEASSSLESAESSPATTIPAEEVPEMQQLDFSEAPWDEAACFALTKYPSYEIDWDSLLATN